MRCYRRLHTYNTTTSMEMRTIIEATSWGGVDVDLAAKTLHESANKKSLSLLPPVPLRSPMVRIKRIRN